MPTVQLQLTAFEASILQRLSQRFPQLNVNEFIRDRLFTALIARLGLDLTAVVQAEQQFITAGKGTACGTTLAVTIGTQPFTYTCVRIAGHLTDGVMARPAHVAPGPDGQVTSWQDG